MVTNERKTLTWPTNEKKVLNFGQPMRRIGADFGQPIRRRC